MSAASSYSNQSGPMLITNEPRSPLSTDFESSGTVLTGFSVMSAAPPVLTCGPITINQVTPQAVGNGWHAIFPGETNLVEVNWGSANNLYLEERHQKIEDAVEQGKEVRVQVRWCTENGTRLEDGSRPWNVVERASKSHEADDVNYSQAEEQPASYSPAPEKTEIVANPWTLEGQQIGAILQVMRAPERIKKIKKGAEFNTILEVGDCVNVLGTTSSSERGTDRMDYIVENKRTRVCVSVPWNTFLPVGTRELCCCIDHACRCVYVDYRKSVGFGRRGNGY